MKPNYLLLAIGLTSSLSLFGQSYYDDDIYYNPSKSKKTQVTTVVTTSDLDYEGPTYQIYSSDMRDVDEYNRRGGIYKNDSIASIDSLRSNSDVFAYTERLERFDNPTIIIASSDSRLKELYYSDDVDIYIGTPTTYISFGGFYDPWYTPYYTSWYYNLWRWNWSYGWSWNAFDPWWGGYYASCWGPHHYDWGGWHNHWGPSHWDSWRHRPAYSDGGRRPFGGNNRAYSNNNSRNTVSGAGINRHDSYVTTGRRPSSSTYQRTQRPNQTVGTTSRPTYNTNGYRGGSVTNQNTNSTRRPSTTTTTTERRSQYTNRETNNSRSNNSGSFRGSSNGGSRGSFSGGGSRGSFGGGGRGGRR